MEDTNDIPKGIKPYVRALGTAGACAFLLKFGGQIIHVPLKPRPNSPLVREIGADATDAMRDAFGSGQIKVPVGRPWVARHLAAEGISRADIAKRLKITRESVRGYLTPPKPKVAA